MGSAARAMRDAERRYDATAKRAKRPARRAGTSARTRTPSGVSSRRTSPASACSSARLCAVGVGHEQLDRAQRVRELALDALASSASPSPVAR